MQWSRSASTYLPHTGLYNILVPASESLNFRPVIPFSSPSCFTLYQDEPAPSQAPSFHTIRCQCELYTEVDIDRTTFQPVGVIDDST